MASALGTLMTLAAVLTACPDSPSGRDAGDAHVDVSTVDTVTTDAADATPASDATDVATDTNATDAADAARGDGGRVPGTANIQGTVNGSMATAVDMAWMADATCGGSNGIVLATSGQPIVCADPLAGQVLQPYILMHLSNHTVGTYNVVAQTACTATTTDPVVTADLQIEGEAGYNGASGTLQITASSSDTISGMLNITFGDPSQGTLTGTFTATMCAP